MQYAYWIIPFIWYTTTQDKYKMSWYCLLSLTDNSFIFTHSLTPLLRTVTMKLRTVTMKSSVHQKTYAGSSVLIHFPGEENIMLQKFN